MAFNDLQVLHVAGLIETALGADVGEVRKAQLAAAPAEGQFPILSVYRRGETTDGKVTARETVQAEIGIEYFLGRKEEQNEEDAWGSLPAIVSRVRRILQQRRHASYPVGAHAGETLNQLCGIEQLKTQPAQYRVALPDGGVEGAYPAFSMAVAIQYEDQGWTTKAALVETHLHHNEPVAHQVPATSQGVPINSKVPNP